MRQVRDRPKPNWAKIYEHAAEIEKQITQVQTNYEEDEDILSLL